MRGEKFDEENKLLCSAIMGKHQARREGVQTATVLSYNMKQSGFVLLDLNLNAIIEKMVGYYCCKTRKELLSRASNSCYILSGRKGNLQNSQFKLKEDF